ncbi:hypothetical protein ABGB12_17995 [Actinocorallia sp. B10E7]|uniref:hypothetical protein n=1 Tax=Actinocorallia sp. B10E7 TaxID=3153558 RepID=UPI00325E4329
MGRRMTAALSAGAVALAVAVVCAAVRWERAGDLPEVRVPPGATSSLPEGERYETRVDNMALAMKQGLEERFGSSNSRIYALPEGTVPAEAVAFVGRSLGEDWAPVNARCRQRGYPDSPGRRFITACRWVEKSRWWPRAVEVAVFDRLDRVPPAYWPDITLLVVATGRGR